MSDLLNGWADAHLDDVCQIVRGITFPTNEKRFEAEEGLIACLRTANVQAAVEWEDLWFVPQHYVKSDEQLVNLDDILISTANSYELVGKVSRVTHKKFDSTLGAFISLLRAHDGIHPGFLYYQMSSESVQRSIREMSSTTTNISNVSGAKLKTLQLHIPPAAEQTRIVAKLEELLSDLDAGVAELKAAQKKLGQYRQSLLKAAVDFSRSGRPYPKVPLGSLVTTIGQGWSPKCLNEPAVFDDQWAVMKTTAIQPLEFDCSHNKLLPGNLNPREHLELKVGDLLVTRAGPRNRVGITCLVKATRPRLILCDKAYRVRCDESRIDMGFLEVVLNAPHIIQRLDELKTGINDSGLNLTQDRFFTLEIPLPPVEEQLLIVERICIQAEAIKEQENAIEVGIKQSIAQRQNILRAAFAGQLVPQDPNDEPASLLLERIRAERAAQASVKKPRGRKAKEST